MLHAEPDARNTTQQAAPILSRRYARTRSSFTAYPGSRLIHALPADFLASAES